YNVASGEETVHRPGLFEMVRDDDGALRVDEETGLVRLGEGTETAPGLAVGETGAPDRGRTIPYWLLVAAGLGIFAGCVGKSAQFPLQTWLPDAMEGPTPVSALVHSATMVAAGVYLAGRFFPMFTPEVLLVIAYVGCITLFLAATIAVVATDIKRVLAYSTISQLGYMMLAIGVGGWGAGLFHLITHAFFKSLMFLASGSVIVACHHEQEMTRMGGLWRKLPITAFTMLVGVIAICGLAVPGVSLPFTFWREAGEPIAFSGYHSKDAIVATAMAFMFLNDPMHLLLFFVPLITAGITAFYMFRLWFYTFAGKPRDRQLYDHVHESPWVMTAPLILLAALAAFCAVGGEGGPLFGLLADSEPAGAASGG
ncbi:MAG: proton-conducting transporter membrane subunit, partial [Planctomycetaceae bacterium]